MGTWSDSATNYSSARFFGDDMMLPAADYRPYGTDGALGARGTAGGYWSSSKSDSYSAWALQFNSSEVNTLDGNRRNGFSVRCIEDSDLPVPCSSTLSSTSGTSISGGVDLSVTVTASRSDCAWTTDNSLSWVSLSPESGTGSGDVTLTVTANTGAARTGSITIAGQTYSVSQDAAIACGAYIAAGVWKEFDCYNLAAIGKTTNDDPFTPSWRLIGGYWQWGRKGPDPSQWYDTNTPNFAHGPTGPETGEANSGPISGWDTSYAPNGAWSDASKTANDPCPAGFRVPTNTQWDGILDTNNNPQSTTGTWSSGATNYTSARKFGDALILPAAGPRDVSSGELSLRGYHGGYWSSSEYTSNSTWRLGFHSGGAGTISNSRLYGFSVRCISE
jgi:uncharacterized protein (TIGR02145 family)